jgi:hypothetical protein
MYDFGSRNYDAALGRWVNVDPLAEKSRRWSPYTYAMDNPVYFRDRDGMSATNPDDIYLNRDGQEIQRVKNDQPDRTFIVRTSTKTNNTNGKETNTNPISGKEARNTESEIKNRNLEGPHMKT